MGDFGLNALADVNLNRFPVILVVADFLAVGAVQNHDLRKSSESLPVPRDARTG